MLAWSVLLAVTLVRDCALSTDVWHHMVTERETANIYFLLQRICFCCEADSVSSLLSRVHLSKVKCLKAESFIAESLGSNVYVPASNTSLLTQTISVSEAPQNICGHACSIYILKSKNHVLWMPVMYFHLLVVTWWFETTLKMHHLGINTPNY